MSDRFPIGVVKRFWIPLTLVLTHAGLVVAAGTEIALSSDPEAAMLWILFWFIDFPISLCVDLLPPIFVSDSLVPFIILLAGTIQWGLVGLLVQQFVKWLRPG